MLKVRHSEIVLKMRIIDVSSKQEAHRSDWIIDKQIKTLDKQSSLE